MPVLDFTIDIDQQLMHEVYLDRLNTGFINRHIYPQLDETYRLIRLLLLDKGLPNTPKQLEAINARIARIIELNSGWGAYTKDMREAALYEMRYVAKQVELPTVASRTLLSFINEQMMVLNGTAAGFWSEFVAGNINGLREQVDGRVKAGYARGLSVNQVLKEIRQEFDGTARKRAESLARTGFSHYVQQARRGLVASEPDYFEEAIFVAVWDNRTSLVCRSNAGKRYKATDPKLPIPPLHPNCRSTIVYGPKGFKLKGQRAAIGGLKGEEARKAYERKKQRTDGKVKYKGKRDLNTFKPETLSSDASHEAWLRRQPRWFVESSLGVTKAKLFLDGKLSLSRFTDMAGRPLTLAELEAADTDLFIALGLAN